MFGRNSFRGGVHAPEHKHLTKNKPIQTLPLPQRVVIPMSQHTGSPCRPLVAVGDEVTEGQKIGESTGFISASVHASISGTVVAIENRPHPVLVSPVPSVIIENKSGQTPAANWSKKNDWQALSAEAIKGKIKEAGIVGMGGAAFPTHVKLSPPADKKIEALILNGAECEPFLTTDHRLMLEKSDEILEGLSLLLKVLDVQTAIIAVEKNKKDAIALFNEKIKQRLDGRKVPDYRAVLKSLKPKKRKKAGGKNPPAPAAGPVIAVAPLKVKYPQGAEKQLIKALLGREVPSGCLPFDVGVVVQNVGTAFAVYEAVVKDKPLIERVVTVSGDGVAKPANVLVRIGTSFRDLVEMTGGLTIALDAPVPAAKMIMGGPMMGLSQYTLEAPVIKGTSGFLVLKQDSRKPPRPCVKCGACVDRCPMGLMPYRLGEFAERDDFTACADFNVKDCMECGVCTFVCPSARPLVHLIKYAKLNLAKQKK